MINHKHKFIFTHIPKTGGSSVHYFFINIDRSHVKSVIRHKTTAQIKAGIEKKVFEDYFKFAYVRNSWDRELSLYTYITQSRHHFFHKEAVKCNDFSTYLKQTYHDKRLAYHQYDWVSDKNGDLLVDFVGRFENLQQDFIIICDKIGIPYIKLPQKNKSNHKHYTEYYDDETRELVAQKYARDIEYFGYEFGE